MIMNLRSFSRIAAVFFALAAGITNAAPAPAHLHERSVSAVSASDLASLAPYTQFARAAYCPLGLNIWSCGAACKANPDFQVTLTGGDGNIVQIFFVGFSPSLNSVIVSHEGTDPTKFLSLLTDVNIPMGLLSPILFPGVTLSVSVHDGFRDQHAITALTILTEVKRLMTAKNTKNVAVVGHSLGGALAELDALFLTLNLPAGTSIKAVTYGTPRVGNPAFASLVDSRVPNFRRINNMKDVIPIVPGRFLGFQHPKGEEHLLSPGNAVSCPGDDDATDAQCQIDSVPNVLAGNIIDHLGPYEGIHIGTIFC